MSDTETRCGHAVVGKDGDEQPCDRPASGWRWYQDVEHEPCLEAACSIHENVGGNRMAALERGREAAAKEAARLRGVVEAVQALADEHDDQAAFCRRSDNPASGRLVAAACHEEAARRLREILASVPSSGEAESGEACPSDPSQPCTPDRMCRRCAGKGRLPTPVVSGGQADGGGERRLSDDVWMPRETLAERVKADGRLYMAGYEDGEAAALAARPVLSREAVRERLNEAFEAIADEIIDRAHIEDVNPPSVAETIADVLRDWADRLAAVLVGQEER